MALKTVYKDGKPLTLQGQAVMVNASAGEDGFSPIATVTQDTDGATITITDKSGTTSATVKNGTKGDKGDTGGTGAKGEPGEKGDKGETGATGPNAVSTTTTSNITGLLKGSAGKVAQAVPNTDYISPDNMKTFLNRQTAINAADTNYTALMARGSSLNSTAITPAVNGAIAWQYE